MTDATTEGALTDLQVECLTNLHLNEWLRPLDLGGGSRTGHSAALARLVDLGLAERRQRFGHGLTRAGTRGSWEYRLTTAGVRRMAAKRKADADAVRHMASLIEAVLSAALVMVTAQDAMNKATSQREQEGASEEWYGAAGRVMRARRDVLEVRGW